MQQLSSSYGMGSGVLLDWSQTPAETLGAASYLYLGAASPFHLLGSQSIWYDQLAFYKKQAVVELMAGMYSRWDSGWLAILNKSVSACAGSTFF